MSRERELERALEAGLEALRAGRSLDDALARYPHLRSETASLLGVAASLSAAPAVGPSPAFRAALRGRLMATARASEERRASGFLGLLRWPTTVSRWPSVAVAALVTVALLGNVTMTASASALPGELLYPVKRLAEQTELRLVGDQDARRILQLRHAEERLKETVALVQRGDLGRAAEAAEAYAATVEVLRPSADTAPPAHVDELSARLVEQQERLRSVLEAAPEAAQPGLERALERSSRGLERAMDVQAHANPAPPPAREDETEEPARGPDRAPAAVTAPPDRSGRSGEQAEAERDRAQNEHEGERSERSGDREEAKADGKDERRAQKADDYDERTSGKAEDRSEGRDGSGDDRDPPGSEKVEERSERDGEQRRSEAERSGRGEALPRDATVKEREEDERRRDSGEHKDEDERPPTPGNRAQPTPVPRTGREGSSEQGEAERAAPGENRRGEPSQKAAPAPNREPSSRSTPRPTPAESSDGREESRERRGESNERRDR